MLKEKQKRECNFFSVSPWLNHTWKEFKEQWG